MTTCKHIWKWKEGPPNPFGVPETLKVWCEKCGERHELVFDHEITDSGNLTPAASEALKWKSWESEFLKKYGISFDDHNVFDNTYINVNRFDKIREEHTIIKFKRLGLWVIEVHIACILVSREILEQSEHPMDTHYDVVPDIEDWIGVRKDKKT